MLRITDLVDEWTGKRERTGMPLRVEAVSAPDQLWEKDGKDPPKQTKPPPRLGWGTLGTVIERIGCGWVRHPPVFVTT